MLTSLDWLIPSATAEAMTPADWLLVVLGIYLHDLGMVVTKDEYENRPKDRLIDFRDERLFQGENGEDYKARLGALTPESQDRFIYEEFIREYHGQRVRAWLAGDAAVTFGDSHLVRSEVERLSSDFPALLRRDLGLICESHHLEDLGDTSKYSNEMPYGNSDEETANLQYAALLLRTADLLHITSDRTPPVLFRALNPTDPISQGEWVKQAAVRMVRAQPRHDEDGKLLPRVQPNTVEVFADFTDANGFFGLTSYLVYAKRQLQRSFDWADASKERTTRLYEFPWRYIDDTRVAVRHYLPQPYEFTIDQQRVLNLLTGHTLYNKTDVVVRELIQNSLDAVRLQALTEEPDWEGQVDVHYDPDDRVLRVKDNGTGMTQRIIEDHLLKVGASRYQDPDFKKEHPTFSAISRFGIGVLSAFMVADKVEILTANTAEPEARELTLRSVHGKYLIKPLSKEVNGPADEVLPHGTRVSLWLRPSAQLRDIAEIVESWIVLPRCNVSVSIGNSQPRRVGFASPGDALSSALTDAGTAVGNEGIEIREDVVKGIELAWAVQWSDYFKNWSLLSGPSSGENDDVAGSLGLCIEGVRVEEGTPGFTNTPFFAVANAMGPNAPKTNVARSGLEDTEERLTALTSVYLRLCEEVSNEVNEMVSTRGTSLTWAVQEARWMLSPLRMGDARGLEALYDAIKSVPTLVLEDDDGRRAVSAEELEQIPAFWTVESNAFESAERMLRELSAEMSVASLRAAFGSNDFDLPDGPLVAGYRAGSLETRLGFEGKEVVRIIVDEAQRRVDLEWGKGKRGEPRWRSLRIGADPRWIEPFDTFQRQRRTSFLIGRDGVGVEGVSTETAVRAFSLSFVLPDTPIARFANRLLDTVEEVGRSFETHLSVLFLESVLRETMPRLGDDPERTVSLLERKASVIDQVADGRTARDVLDGFVDLEELARAAMESSWNVFDPKRWLRKGDGD